MTGQLQNNFKHRLHSISLGAFLLTSVCLAPLSASAADIGGSDQITASTSMTIWSGFTVDQIVDGVEPGASGMNGFTTNSKTGTITLDFDQPYDLDGFKLWNDVVVRAEGIKTFRLDFKTASGDIRSTQIFETTPRQIDVQLFNFPKVVEVLSADLVILSSLNEPADPPLQKTFLERIEVREVAFTGKATLDGMKEYIAGLQETINGHEDRIAELMDLLTKEKNRADTTFELLQTRDATIAKLNEEIIALKAEIERLKNGETSKLPLILRGLALLSLGSLFGFLMGRRSKPPAPTGNGAALNPPSTDERQRKLKPSFPVYVLKPKGQSFAVERKQYPQDMTNYDAEKEELIINPPTGLVFENSKLVPSQGGIPSAAAAIDKAYHAVGRVGLAQDGPAIGDDESCGTAILIDEDRVMTNRHVFDRHYHRIIDAGDPFGIEFFGEKDSDATEFYELTIDDVVIIAEYDAVILKLAKPVPTANRTPIKFASKPPISFDDSDVLVIGYPAEPSLMTDAIEEAMGGDDVFSVKRYSEGKMFRHPQDNQGEYGIESHVNGQYSEKGWLLAICHKASTLPGNSGSVVLSKETGDLVALHYGSDQFDRHETLEKHPANVAHAGMFLAKSVTFITSGGFKKYIEQDHK